MNIIAALLVFGFIIFFHELGHFYFAKRAGVTIYEFSIGMGPKIFNKEKNGTLYSLRLFPIGGYVSMAGEDEESDDPNSFDKKTLPQRFLSIIAGPLANILLCILLLIPVFLTVGTPTSTVFSNVIENSAASDAGLKKGDKVISINGKKVDSFDEITKTITKNKDKELTLEYERDGKTNSVKLSPRENAGRYVIGIQADYEKNPAKAIPYAFKTTYDISKTMLSFLFKLITGQLSNNIANSVSGPVGVISMVSNAATTGFMNLLYLTAVISLNIGIMNLLPIPALDGWRILLLFIEGIRGGKKLSSKVEGYINGAGFVLLMALMLFVTYKDVLRLIKG